MRRQLSLLILLGVVGCDAGSPVDPGDPGPPIDDGIPREVSGSPVAFADVAVVPMDVAEITEHQTVIVRNGLIAAVGHKDSVTIGADVVVVPGEGTRYLMPGLADMHVHLNGNPGEARNEHILYLANGVTTIRDMWGYPSAISLSERAAIESGLALGPRIYACSPGMDSSPATWANLTPPVDRADEARLLVRAYAAQGYDCIKVYTNLRPNVFEAIIDEAALQGVPAVGHVPWEIGLERAIEAGQITMEHFRGLVVATSSNQSQTGVLDEARVRELAILARDRGVWMTPTIVVRARTTADWTKLESDQAYRYMGPNRRNGYHTGNSQGADPATVAAITRNRKIMTRIVTEVGGNLLLGTDTGVRYVFPGFAIHDELEYLVEAGLTPYQALRTGTVNPATFLANNAGVVATGSRADLILVNANPLDEVANVRNKRAGVMVNGRWLSNRRLNEMLEDIRSAYSRP